jgi:phosphoribosylaminoimidazole-succinocarboxamide synthase
MGIDRRDLQALCNQTLRETDFRGLGERVVGKVRDSYLGPGRRTLVVTDRVSCFDRVVGHDPCEGPAA